MIRSGRAPRVLELCSGCGGLSLGLETAGFHLAAHIELDQQACLTYAENFMGTGRKNPVAWAKPRDMQTQSISELIVELGIDDRPSQAFDVLAAGLPCQAFARIGRSKLRSVTGDDRAFKNDPRASLYHRFIDIIDETSPLVVILENVPDIMNFGGHNVPEDISGHLKSKGYSVKYTLLNSAYYGVPQFRDRLFLVAVDSSVGDEFNFPVPGNFINLPKGYEGTRAVAFKYVPEGGGAFVPPPSPDSSMPAAITARDALADLPYLSTHLRDLAAARRVRVQDRIAYPKAISESAYASMMKSWRGFETGADVSGNAIRLTARDFCTFGKMPRGGDYPVALKVAQEILAERLLEAGSKALPGSLEYEFAERAIVPPYDPEKFPNKWWKLVPELPSRTLTAHLGKDTYSHIHYDGRQKRMISVREAARLQSFPDGFEFPGAMNASFKQIGNAVPPILGLALATSVIRVLRGRS